MLSGSAVAIGARDNGTASRVMIARWYSGATRPVQAGLGDVSLRTTIRGRNTTALLCIHKPRLDKSVRRVLLFVLKPELRRCTLHKAGKSVPLYLKCSVQKTK